MGWFRTETGHLVHAEGSHAAVCVASGWVQVDDDTAVAEAREYEEQRVAAVEAARADALGLTVTVEHQTHADLTDEELAEVGRAIADEGPTLAPGEWATYGDTTFADETPPSDGD